MTDISCMEKCIVHTPKEWHISNWQLSVDKGLKSLIEKNKKLHDVNLSTFERVLSYLNIYFYLF